MKKKNKFLELCDELLNENENFENEKFYNLKKILKHEYTGKNDKLIVPIGICNDGEYVYMDLEEVSGIFISGTTGTGKSVFLDTLIVSLMLKNSPEEISFLMIDPKKVELGEYNGISYINLNNHYKKYAIYNSERGLKALEFLLKIINERTDFLVNSGCKSIKSYNLQNKEKMSHIFIFIDEASNILEMNDCEKILGKILNVGRALGIHLILATNSNLKKLFTKRFISRFKYRMSFDLTDEEQALYAEIEGADILKEAGDSLIRCPGEIYYRFQAPFTQNDEIKRVSDKVGNRV